MPPPLTAPQREILALLGRDLPEQTWEEVRDLLADYFARRATDEADRHWDREGFDSRDADRLLRGHDRRSS
jgi:hypothetical protein